MSSTPRAQTSRLTRGVVRELRTALHDNGYVDVVKHPNDTLADITADSAQDTQYSSRWTEQELKNLKVLEKREREFGHVTMKDIFGHYMESYDEDSGLPGTS